MDASMQGTLKPYPNFSADRDAEALRKAMKGLGTDEDSITAVLASRTAAQRVEIVKKFKTMFGKDLIEELESEISGNYLLACKGLCQAPADFDADCLYKAMKGAGTDDECLVEILCTRTNAQITAIKEAYKRLHHAELEEDILGDTSGNFQRLLVSMVTANRDESAAVDHGKVETDAQMLFEAGENTIGTDESRFNVILASRSFPHLRAVFEVYKRIAKKDIEDTLKSEMSGDLLQGMLAIVRCVKYRPVYFATALYKAMKGAGTKDESLLRIIVTRCEIDMVQIKQAFQSQYEQTLAQFIEDDTGGDFCNILLKLIGEPLKK